MLICLDMRTGAGCGEETVESARFCEHCGQNLRFALLLHDAGTLVGAYRVVRTIGYGGFGAIYEALDASGQRVALKETFDTSSISTFAREFAVLSQLKHANLPRYIEMFEAQGNGYLVMEYVPGQSLQEILDIQTDLLPESQVLGYALQLCDVLAYLHAQQPPILHRDVKPANIRLTSEGRIKLVDFGLLKQGGYQTRATIRGLGTPAYAPIEQYAHDERATNPQSDIYALGATLFHLLSAKEPPSAPSRLAKLANPNPNNNENEDKNEDDALPPLPAGLSPHLKEAIIKAMSVMPDGRFANMEAFKQALQGTQPVDQSISAQPTPQNEPETPVSPPLSALNRAASWLTETFIQTRYSYVKPANAKSLPYLPFKVSGEVLKVAFHSDGQRQSLMGMTNEGIVYQWRVPDGQLLKLLSLAVPDEVEAFAYSPTGDTVATASKDYIIRIWRTQDGQLLHKLRGHGGLVSTLTYAPTGNVLASGSHQDNQICFWHVATGKLLRKIDEDTWLTSLAFSPDGSHLLGSNYHTSYLWRLADDKRLRTIKLGCCNESDIQWDPTGKMLIYGRPEAVVIQDPMKKEPIHRFEYKKSYFGGVAWHPNGQQFAAGNSKGLIRIFTLPENEPAYLCKAHKEHVLSLAYTPDGRFLASGGKDEKVCLWAFDSAHLPATTLAHKEPLEVIESPFLDDEKGASASSSAWIRPSTEVEQLSNYVEATHELDLPHLVCDGEGHVCTVGYSVDGKELIALTHLGTLYRWRVQDGKLIKKQALPAVQNQFTSAAISPDGQTLATGGKNLIVRLWRLKDGKLLHELHGHMREIKALAYTADSRVLASSGGKDGTIRLWRVADGKLLRTVKAKKETICLKFSPSGQYLACGSSDSVHIWRTKDQKWRRKIKKGCYNEHCISWSPDERFLSSAHGNKVHIWRVVDGQNMIDFRGHNNTIKAVAWHPNSQLVLSASYDKSVRVWSPLAPPLRHVGEGHKNSVRCVAVSPDGRTFASGSEDGTVRLWFLRKPADGARKETLNQTFLQAAPTTNSLETPIQEQSVGAPSTISRTKTAAALPPASEPSILRKFSRWVTRQLSD